MATFPQRIASSQKKNETRIVSRGSRPCRRWSHFERGRCCMSRGPSTAAPGGQLGGERVVAVVRTVQHHRLAAVPAPLAVLPGRDRLLELVRVHLAGHPP